LGKEKAFYFHITPHFRHDMAGLESEIERPGLCMGIEARSDAREAGGCHE
jgi:hypothetical protein